MATYEKDLYIRTWVQQGVKSNKLDRQRITGLVSLGTWGDTRAGLSVANTVAIAARGPLFSPDDATLPLQTCQAREHGTSEAIVTLDYFRRSIADSGTVSSFDLPRVVTGIVSVPKYTFTSNSAGGDVQVGTARFIVRYDDEPVMTIRAPFSGGSSTISSSWATTGKANNNSPTWSGFSFPTNSLRYDGLIQEGRVVNGTAEFDLMYQFTAKRTLWTRETPTSKGTVQTDDIYEFAAFNNTVFPTP